MTFRISARMRIDGKTVYEGRILDLEVDRVGCQTGRGPREVVRHRGAVVVLPLLPDGRIVLVRQHRYPTGEVLLELPAGKLDPGEPPVVCAVRELEEETGWRAAETTRSVGSTPLPAFTDEVLHAFVATALEAAPTMPRTRTRPSKSSP